MLLKPLDQNINKNMQVLLQILVAFQCQLQKQFQVDKEVSLLQIKKIYDNLLKLKNNGLKSIKEIYKWVMLD